jgi:hypothetical protein
MASSPSATAPAARYGVRFFAYSADAKAKIDEWARREGVRVLKTVPIHYVPETEPENESA